MNQTVTVVAIFVVVGVAVTARAAPVDDCSRAVQDTRVLAANISQNANIYWGHRKNFVSLKFGPPRNNADAKTLADAEVVQLGQLKALVPSKLGDFRVALARARSKNCLSVAELRVIEEAAFTQVRKISFDRLPGDESEATSGPAPRKMPP